MKIWILILALFTCLSCEQTNLSPPTAEDGIGSAMTFFKRGGACFAAIKSFSHGGHYIASLTWMPCDVWEDAQK